MPTFLFFSSHKTNRLTNFGRSIKVRSSEARVGVCFVTNFPAIEFQFRCLQSFQGIRTRVSNLRYIFPSLLLLA